LISNSTAWRLNSSLYTLFLFLSDIGFLLFSLGSRVRQIGAVSVRELNDLLVGRAIEEPRAQLFVNAKRGPSYRSIRERFGLTRNEMTIREEHPLWGDQLKASYSNLARRTFARASPPIGSSVLWLVISQPGGGKSTAIRERSLELESRGGCVHIDRDTIRANHSRLFRRTLNEQLRLNILDPEAEPLERQLVFDAINDGYNLAVTTRLRNLQSVWFLPLVRPDLATERVSAAVGLGEALSTIREAGLRRDSISICKARISYWVGFDVIARKDLASYLSCYERYVTQIAAQGMARAVDTPDVYRKHSERTGQLLEWAEEQGLAHQVIVRNHTQVLYDSVVGGPPHGSRAAWTAERERPWTTEECQDHRKRWMAVLDHLSRLAKESENRQNGDIYAERFRTAIRVARADVFRLFSDEEGCSYFPNRQKVGDISMAAESVEYAFARYSQMLGREAGAS
jgi:Zeta toxin